MKIILTTMVLLTFIFAQTPIVVYDGDGKKDSLIVQGFDAVIDLYLESTIEEKLDFISSLDDEELEVFMIYLKEKYPEEFDLLP
jgi:hypothetical protein